jgi:hypothetical protein
MMDKPKTPRRNGRSYRYLTLCRGVLDLSIIQWPFSINEVPNLSITIRKIFIAVSHCCCPLRHQGT